MGSKRNLHQLKMKNKRVQEALEKEKEKKVRMIQDEMERTKQAAKMN
jgi:hypothetical protein